MRRSAPVIAFYYDLLSNRGALCNVIMVLNSIFIGALIPDDSLTIFDRSFNFSSPGPSKKT